MTADDECDKDDRPWEALGAFRRDCAPHRAELTKLLGTLSMSCVIGSFCLGITAVGGLIFGITACRLAGSDLHKMSAGLMEPGGKGETVMAHARGTAGICCSILFGSLWCLFVVMSLLR